MNGWKTALGAAALLAGQALADGGAAEVIRSATLTGTLTGFTETVPQTEVPDMLARLMLANASGRDWQALDVRIEVLMDASKAFETSTFDDSIRFGQAVQVYATWREQLELRINGVYAGKPGGNWEVSFAQDTEVMRVRFVEPLIHPGDQLEVRFPVTDSGVQLWRMNAEARAVSRESAKGAQPGQ